MLPMLIMRLLCVWHRMAVCFAHYYAVPIASPGGGPLSLWARSTAGARVGSGGSSSASGTCVVLLPFLSSASIAPASGIADLIAPDHRTVAVTSCVIALCESWICSTFRAVVQCVGRSCYCYIMGDGADKSIEV